MAKPQKWLRDHGGWIGLIGGTLLMLYPTATLAQIAGDGTLGTQVNGSTIAPCTGVCTITDGATRGSNLFHSFGQFSLPNPADSATFQTTPTIQNVIVRVTGIGQPFISNINGLIATTNSANFFLLNPNGIVFGPGATLNIGGSFLATTATQMQFADGSEFRTDAPTSLLTISVPIGLQFGQAPGTIEARRAQLRIGRTDPLGRTNAFRDFSLVGGDVVLDNSVIQVLGRWVAVGGVGKNGTVQLQVNGDRLRFGLSADTLRHDITLTNRSAIVNISASGGGGSEVTGRNITLSQSDIVTGIVRGINNAITNQAGDIMMNAAANLKLIRGSAISNEVALNAIGQGGNINIVTANLQASDGSNIATRRGGNGNAGNVQIIANTIALDGNLTGIGSIVVGTTGSGRGGDVMVKTSGLTLTNGATVSASAFGNGNAGNVKIAANAIVLFGSTPNGKSGSGIFSQVVPGVRGNAGNITIETGSLTATNGAAISSSTFGSGNAGNVRITANMIVLDGTTPDGGSSSGIFSAVNSTGIGQSGEITVDTGSLTITNGAAVSAKTFGSGNGGNVQITADTIVVDGTTPDRQFASSITSEVGRTGSGRSGDIMIKSGSLNVTRQATVSTSAFGNGSAGNLDITTRTLRLDLGGSINASAFFGDGANLNLNIGELLLMRHGSGISTSAGLARVGGNGGNITITAPRGFLVTAPNENNDITANAFNGSGGRVTINAQGIYGFISRSRAELAQLLGTNDPTQLAPRRLPTNDITAISQDNPDLSGTVTLNILNLDPSRGLVALPLNLTDPAQKITQSCTPGSKTAGSSFVATGRGGIPLNPDEPLESRAVVTQWVALPEGVGEQGSEGVRKQGRIQASKSEIPAPIVEARGWIIRPDGGVELVAEVPTGSPANFSIATAPCPIPQSP